MNLYLCVLALLMGWFAAALLMKRHGLNARESLVNGLAWAPCVAFSFLSATWFIWLDVAQEPPGPVTLALVIVCIACVILRVGKSSEHQADHEQRRWHPLMTLVFGLGILLPVFRFWDVLRSKPDGHFDSIAVWHFAARFLHRAGIDYRELIHDLPQFHHPDYPLLIPASLASIWQLGEGETPGVGQIIQLSFYLGLPMMMVHILNGLVGRWASFFAGLFVASIPVYIIHVTRNCADVVLAYFLLAAAGGVASSLRSKRTPGSNMILTGIALGALPWTKNEGIPLALLIILFFIVLGLRRMNLKSVVSNCLRIFAGALVPLLALLIFKIRWAPNNEFASNAQHGILRKLSELERWDHVFDAFRAVVIPVDPSHYATWGISWSLVLGMIVFGFVSRRRKFDACEGFLSIASFGSLFGWVLIEVVTPYDLEWQVRASWTRLLLQIFPLFVLLGFCLTQKRPTRNLSRS